MMRLATSTTPVGGGTALFYTIEKEGQCESKIKKEKNQQMTEDFMQLRLRPAFEQQYSRDICTKYKSTCKINLSSVYEKGGDFIGQ